MENLPDPPVLIVMLGTLGVMPFLIVMGTSFVKLVVVFGLVRNALGIQSIPPNIAIHGLALVLSVYIMMPVGLETYDALAAQQVDYNNLEDIGASASGALAPYKEFLIKHAGEQHVDFFIETASTLWGEERQGQLTRDNLFVLIPAFVVGELTSAFAIGFLIYLPFIVIDLIISNILLAMGMMMMSPITISLPLKLLLFVFLDGWEQLVQGLILSYQ